MRILILGGTGTLGAQLAARLRAAGHSVAATGRELDATDVDMLTEYARRHDVVVSLAPVPAGFVQLACARAGVPSVDTAGDVDERLLGEADQQASRRHDSSHVVAVGLFPGLSGLLAHGLAAAAPGRRVDVVLEQSSNARVGPAGMRAMLGMIERGPGFRRGSEVLLPLDHPEAEALRSSGIAVEYLTRWDSPGQTRAVGALAALGLLPALIRLPEKLMRQLARHRPGVGEQATLTVRAAGSGLGAMATARSDYGATAAVLAAVATRAAEFPPGVHRLWEAVELTAIAEEISDVVALTGDGCSLP